VTKHADIKVSSQTVKTCLIKPGACVVRMLASNMFDARLSKRTKHQTREQKRCLVFDRMFDGFQILSNTTKHNQTRSKSTKQGVQTVKCLVTKQCLMVFGRQTFPVCPGPWS